MSFLRIFFPAIAFAFAIFHGTRSLDWCQELLSPLISSTSETILNIPWSVYGEAIAAKIIAVTSHPEYPFTPWLVAIVSLVISMTPTRNVREARKVLAGSRAVFSIALFLCIVCTAVNAFSIREQVMNSLIIKPSLGCVYNVIHILMCLFWYPCIYPVIKYMLGLILSETFIEFQLSSQLPPAMSMTEVLDESPRATEASTTNAER